MMNSVRSLRSEGWLLVISAVTLVSSFGIGLTNPVLSLYGQVFTPSRMLVGTFIMTFALGRVAATIPASHAARRWGYLTIMVVGLLAKALGSFAVASAQSFAGLLAPRFIDGVGDSLVMASAVLAIAVGSPSYQRGKNTSLFQTAAFLGLALSPTLGGSLADAYGVRSPIWIQSAISLSLAALLWVVARRFPVPDRMASDAQAQSREDRHRNYRHGSARFDFVLVALSAFLIFVARAGARDTLLPIYARERFDLDSYEIGLLFNAFAIMNLACVPLAGYLLDRIGRKKIVSFGLSLLGVGALVVGNSSSYAALFAGVVVMACGKGLSEPATVVYLADIANPEQISGSFGLFLTLRDLGLVAGPILLGLIADLADLHMAYTLSGVAFGLCAVVFLKFAWEGYRGANPRAVL